MATYMVTYDLMKTGQNYTCITKKLESYGVHWHVQGSVWIIHTNQTAVQVRDYLTPCLDENDKLIVARLNGEAAWYGYPDKTSEWLRDCLNNKYAA